MRFVLIAAAAVLFFLWILDQWIQITREPYWMRDHNLYMLDEYGLNMSLYELLKHKAHVPVIQDGWILN